MMKKKWVFLLAAVLVAVCACTAFAEDSDWQFDADYLFVRGYQGTAAHVEMPTYLDNCPVEVLCDGVLMDNQQIESIILSDALLDLRQSNFVNMPLLRQVKLPESLIIIGDSNFMYCDALEEVTIPSRVSYIGSHCFYACAGLKRVTFTGVCPVFGPDCFDFNGNDLVVAVPDDQLDAYKAALPEWVSVVPSGVNAVVQEFPSDENNYAVYEDGTVAAYGGFETRVDVPGELFGVAVSKIGDYAFPSSYYITYITLPEGITEIGEYAFSDMQQLAHISLPSTLKVIGAHAFENFRGHSIVLPEGLETIGELALNNAFIKGELVLPSTLKNISADFLNNCSILEKLVVKCDPMVLPEELKTLHPYLEIVAAEDADEQQIKKLNAYLHGAPELLIAQQPQDVFAAAGEQVYVEVAASGDDLSYTWYYRDVKDKQFTVSEEHKDAYYTVTMDDSVDGRQVYCVVTDIYGASVESDMAMLSMKTVLGIAVQPVSVTVPEGATAYVSVEAVGDELTYAWYCKNFWDEDFALAEMFTGSTYMVDMNMDYDGQQVYCVVTDKYGSTVETDVATLSMELADEPEYPAAVQPDFPVPDAVQAAPYVGSWKAQTLTENGQTYQAADVFMVMKMTLNGDGTALFAQDEFSEPSAIWWYTENGVAYVGDAEGVFTVTAADGGLILEMDGLTVHFVPDDGTGAAAGEMTDEEAMALFLQMMMEMENGNTQTGEGYATGFASPEERLEKKFVCTGFTAGGIYQDDETLLGAEYSLLFHENGTVDFVMAGTPLPGATWAADTVNVGLEAKDAFVVNYYTVTYNALLTDTGFDLDYYGTVLHMEMAE